MNLQDVIILGSFLNKDDEVVAKYDHVCFGRLPRYTLGADSYKFEGLSLDTIESIRYFQVDFADYTTPIYGYNIVTSFLSKLQQAIKEVDGFVSFATRSTEDTNNRKSKVRHYTTQDFVIAKNTIHITIDLENTGNIATFWLCAVLRYIQTNPDVVKNTLTIMEISGRNFYESLLLACHFKLDERDLLQANPEAYLSGTFSKIKSDIDLSYYLSKDVQNNFVSSFDYKTDKMGNRRSLENGVDFSHVVFQQDSNGRFVDYGSIFNGDVSQFDALFT